jgi:HlyD family secretion protein
MMRLLRNDLLVKSMAAAGAPYMVTVRLTRDAAAPSGFRWTSAGGPKLLVESGTTCLARIVVESERPITMLFPAIRRFLGLV